MIMGPGGTGSNSTIPCPYLAHFALDMPTLVEVKACSGPLCVGAQSNMHACVGE